MNVFSRRILRAALAAGSLVALTFFASTSRAGDLDLQGGLGAEGSSWAGDAAIFSSLTLGYRMVDWAEIYAGGRLGYAGVDHRLLTMIGVGAKFYGKLGSVRPYARLGLVHQHEESLVDVKAEPAGALFGVGDGIRHRAGGDFGLGAELPLYRIWTWQAYAGAEALVTTYPDPRGPTVYGGGMAFLGGRFAL